MAVLTARVLSEALRSLRPGARPAAAGPKLVIVVGAVATVVMVALLAAGQAIDFGVFNLRLRALNTDSHFSVFGVASLLAQVGAGTAGAWRGAHSERHRWAWLTLGGLLVVLTFGRALTSYNGEVLAAPLACCFGLLCWLTWRDPGAARVVVGAALLLLVTSLLLHEVGVDADSSNASDYSWGYQILAIVKHGTELAGWMLVATGVVAGTWRRRSADSSPAGIAALPEPVAW